MRLIRATWILSLIEVHPEIVILIKQEQQKQLNIFDSISLYKGDLCFDFICVPKERRVVFSVILVSPYQNLEFNTYTQCNSRSSSQHHPPTLLNESVNWNGTPCIISITCSNSDVRARDSEVALAPYCNFVNTILALSKPKVY